MTNVTVRRIIVVAPVVLLALCTAGLAIPRLRPITLWLLQENHPVEISTFLVLFLAGAMGLSTAWRARTREGWTVVGFYGVFATALLFVAMEEVAWGQAILGFDTPTWMRGNVQGELTVHNLRGLHGRSEFFRLAFGLGGLIALTLPRVPILSKFAAPPILASWFLVITIHAGLDGVNDFVSFGNGIDYGMQRSSELIEMLIGTAALLYLFLNARRLDLYPRDDKPRVISSRRGH